MSRYKESSDAWSFSSASLALADDGVFPPIIIRSGAGTPRVRIGVSAGGNGSLQMYEGVAMTTSGTLISPIQRNRVTGDGSPPDVTVRSGGTLRISGTLLFTEALIGPAKEQVSGANGPDEEWNLLPNTGYALLITNLSGGAAPFSVMIDCYEETIT